MSNVCEPSWSWIPKSLSQSKREKENFVCKTWNSVFSRRRRAVPAKKCTKKRDARAKLLFCWLKLLFFFTFSMASLLSYIELFHSRGQHPCKFIATKERVFNSHRICLEYQNMAAVSLFGTPTWPPFHCFETPIWPTWRHMKTLYTFYLQSRTKV